MPMVKIKNTSQANQGVHTVSGIRHIGPGQIAELDVHPNYLSRLNSLPFLALGAEADRAMPVRPAGEDPRIANMAAEIERLKTENAELAEKLKGIGDAPSKLEAKHKGGGSYSVWDADGNEVLSKLSKDDAEAFNDMTVEEQADYVGKSKAA